MLATPSPEVLCTISSLAHADMAGVHVRDTTKQLPLHKGGRSVHPVPGVKAGAAVGKETAAAAALAPAAVESPAAIRFAQHGHASGGPGDADPHGRGAVQLYRR